MDKAKGRMKERRANSPERRVALTVSKAMRPVLLKKATQAGADEMLDKLASSGEILGAVRRIGAGE